MLRASSFLLAATALAGCVQPPGGGSATRANLSAAAFPAPGTSTRKIAVLLPLSGQNAALGRDLLRAVQLALGPDGPQPDVQDTGGTPTGATLATRAAVAAGDVVIVGPLTAQETAATAAAAGTIPVLAFTSDRQQGRPGVWALGITPQQQVGRLVQALSRAGKVRVAAVLPDNGFGSALADGLNRSASQDGDPVPVVRRYPTGRPAALDSALRDISDVADRTNAAQQPDPAAALLNSPTAQTFSRDANPPPFDALLLAESGPSLQPLSAALPKYGLVPPGVQIVGPATWARDAANLGGFAGAWYAAPDPATRGAFEQIYTARYDSPPPSFASIAYDAAQLARVAASDPSALTQSGGFRGADGPIALRPDGQVARGLAVFAIGPAGTRIVEPVPASIASGS